MSQRSNVIAVSHVVQMTEAGTPGGAIAKTLIIINNGDWSDVQNLAVIINHNHVDWASVSH
jgi:hypothetical protein